MNVIKKNFIFIFSIVVVVAILMVSQSPVEVIVFMAFGLGTLCLPGMRNMLVKDGPRKVKAALYTSLVFTFGVFIFHFFISLFNGVLYSSDVLSVLMILIFSLMGNFLYGVPASIAAEMISKRFMGNRFWVSGLIHIGFGGLTYFYHPGFSVAAVCCSVLFFMLDERIRRNH